jgi:ribosomal-protein-alanine N-acetyltransferase
MRFTAMPACDHELVTLRPIVAADLPVWHRYLCTPAVFEHTSWNAGSVEDLSKYVWQPAAVTASTLLRFAVASRSSSELVGTAGFHSVSPENRSAELAFDLAPSLWGKGVATFVCRRLVDWAHSHVGLVRIQATALETNQRSLRVLERCEFVREGLLRAYRMVRGRPGNFWMYSHVAEK